MSEKKAMKFTSLWMSSGAKTIQGAILCRLTFLVQARLPQRVAMDDLASYFVEERSKVR
jgi:hypothetical protein